MSFWAQRSISLLTAFSFCLVELIVCMRFVVALLLRVTMTELRSDSAKFRVKR